MENNINIRNVIGFEKQIYDNLSASQKIESVSGAWNFENEAGQFKAVVKSEHGNAIMLTGNATSLGGDGVHPSPIQFMLFGIASSIASLIALRAAIYKYNIRDLIVNVSVDTNYDKFFSLDNRPPVEKINITVNITSEENEDVFKKLKDDAFDCCPALFLVNKEIETDFIFNVHQS